MFRAWILFVCLVAGSNRLSAADWAAPNRIDFQITYNLQDDGALREGHGFWVSFQRSFSIGTPDISAGIRAGIHFTGTVRASLLQEDIVAIPILAVFRIAIPLAAMPISFFAEVGIGMAFFENNGDFSELVSLELQEEFAINVQAGLNLHLSGSSQIGAVVNVFHTAPDIESVIAFGDDEANLIHYGIGVVGLHSF